MVGEGQELAGPYLAALASDAAVVSRRDKGLSVKKAMLSAVFPS